MPLRSSQLDNEIQLQAQAEANVKTAEAAVETAKLNLSFSASPLADSGVAGQATTQVGNLVSTQSVLTSVSQLDPIKVYFSISDSGYLALTHARRDGRRRSAERSSEGSADAYAFATEIISRQGTHRVRRSADELADRRDPHRGRISESRQPPAPRPVWPRISRHRNASQALLVPQAAVDELQGQQQVYTVGPDNQSSRRTT